MHLLFLRRDDCTHSERAEAYLRQLFEKVTVVRSTKLGDRLPENIHDLRPDVVLAFRSHIIIPEWLIDSAKVCLNFHPGPPERPGIGCVNFALYEGDAEYGSTCHFVAKEIDSGPIVSVKRFPIDDSDTVASLLARAYDYLLCQLYDVAPLIASDAPLEVTDERWARKATRKKDLDALMNIPIDAPADEISRVVRATTFGNFGPFVTINGARFRLCPAEPGN